MNSPNTEKSPRNREVFSAPAKISPQALQTKTWVISALTVGILGYLDYATGFEISLFVFYFAPVGYAAWRLGLLPGLVMSVCSAVVWAAADVGAGHVYSQPAYAVWSALVRLSAFLTVAWLVARNASLLAAERTTSSQLRQILAEVKLLEGLLPICATCKKIRDDQGKWEQMEQYIQNHTHARFSHGVCPECAKKWIREAGLDESSKT